MLELMKLELKKTNTRTYGIAAAIIAVAMLGFLYLLAYAPGASADENVQLLANFDLDLLFGIMDMTAFSILAAVMYAKFIIADYSGNRPILLFSYPTSRKKVFWGKIIIVALITAMPMFVGGVVSLGIFAVTENTFSTAFLLRAVQVMLLMSLTAVGIGVVSAGIGFIKKSVPATIVAAVLIDSLISNVVMAVGLNMLALLVVTIFFLLSTGVCAIVLSEKINKMEATCPF
jgi:ABC-type transport system involved in multi-copper enzyme maturation permease subunit